MKIQALALTLSVVFLSGCATYDKSVPDGYVGPTATIEDTVTMRDNSLAHIFDLVDIEGRKLRGSRVATLVASSGRGMLMQPVTETNQIPAKELTVTIEGNVVYAAPILAMLNTTCSIKGTVKFKAVAGRKYKVNGELLPSHCAVWIEDLTSMSLASDKIVGAGRK